MFETLSTGSITLKAYEKANFPTSLQTATWSFKMPSYIAPTNIQGLYQRGRVLGINLTTSDVAMAHT